MALRASAILEDINAVHGLLIASQPMGGAEMAKVHEMQTRAMLQKLALVKPTTSEATQLLSSISNGPWPQVSKTALCNKIHERLADVSSASVQNMATRVQSNSCRCQAFTTAEHYLPASIWKAMGSPETPQRIKIQGLASFIVTLGCRSPSEKSVQHMVGLLLLATLGKQEAFDMDPTAKLCVVHDFKKLLKTCAAKRPCQGGVVPEYPNTPEDFKKLYPDIYKDAYPAEEPQQCQLHYTDMQEAPSMNMNASFVSHHFCSSPLHVLQTST